MSLDVYLELEYPVFVGQEPEIYIRSDGANCKVTRAEWDALYPGREPITITPDAETRAVYSANITHNLGRMAKAAGIYQALWRPEEIGITTAHQLVAPLTKGLQELANDTRRFDEFAPANGWGTYDGLMQFITAYIDACIRYPDATIGVSR